MFASVSLLHASCSLCRSRFSYRTFLYDTFHSKGCFMEFTTVHKTKIQYFLKGGKIVLKLLGNSHWYSFHYYDGKWRLFQVTCNNFHAFGSTTEQWKPENRSKTWNVSSFSNLHSIFLCTPYNQLSARSVQIQILHASFGCSVDVRLLAFGSKTRFRTCGFLR